VNYYPHHIGDFNNSTRHLTRVERSIYRDMIELYYDTEQPLLRDVKALCRRLLARTEEEVTAVQQVLNEFFTETEQGWFHDRCDAEIRKYHKNIEDKSAAGKASAAARAAGKTAPKAAPAKDLPPNSTPVEQPLPSCSTNQNQEPRTKNQEPDKSAICAGATSAADLSIAMRKKGVQTQPADPRLIELAAQGVSVEVVEAACDVAIKAKPNETIGIGYVLKILERWAREAAELKAGGAMPNARASPVGYESAKDRSRREAAEKLTGRRPNEQRNPSPHIIDIN